mgnify:CR=1 FL=1
MSDRAKFSLIAGVFLAAYFVPLQHPRVRTAIWDMFVMLQDYAQKHVLFCLVPAFFIAGAIAIFISQASVLKYFGPKANKVLSYGVASVSGTVLAVCSCTVLPLFAGLYTRGAGIGPAIGAAAGTVIRLVLNEIIGHRGDAAATPLRAVARAVHEAGARPLTRTSGANSIANSRTR